MSALFLSACGVADDFGNDKKLVADSMKDPSSVQFRNMRRKNDSYNIVCGEVNAKNGYGGYVGFVPFEIYTNPDKRRILRIHTDPKGMLLNPDTDALMINSSIEGDCAF
ncbi:MAG: hypothetical protein ACREPT_12700 [Rudaea sp.]